MTRYIGEPSPEKKLSEGRALTESLARRPAPEAAAAATLGGSGVTATARFAWRNIDTASLFTPTYEQADGVPVEPKSYGSIVELKYAWTDGNCFQISTGERPAIRLSGFPGGLGYEYMVWASCGWNASLNPYGPTSGERSIDVRARIQGGGTTSRVVSRNAGGSTLFDWSVLMLTDFPGSVQRGAWRDQHVAAGTDTDKEIGGTPNNSTSGYNLFVGPDLVNPADLAFGGTWAEITPFVTFYGGLAADRFVRSWKMTVIAVPSSDGSSVAGSGTINLN